MRLIQIKEITGKITLLTGLHIGAGDTEMRIGGTDNTVIKHPHTLEPYIPGSSLKGKVRSLLELRSGLMGMTDGNPLSVKHLKQLESNEEQNKAEQCKKILMLFGTSGADGEEAVVIGPTRVSFSDCHIDDEWRNNAFEQNLAFTEIKPENAINRIKGTAEHPRFTERVPARVRFKFHICLRIMEGDDKYGLESFLIEGLKLLEMDSLGGNGSRGYGKIKFDFDNTDLQRSFNNLQLF